MTPRFSPLFVACQFFCHVARGFGLSGIFTVTPLVRVYSRLEACPWSSGILLYLLTVFVFKGCSNKLSQTGWLKTIEIDSFLVPEARSLKSKCQQGHTPSETLGRILPWLSLASGGSHQSWVFLGLNLHHTISASVITWHVPMYLSGSLLLLWGHQSYWIKGSPHSTMTSS